MSSKLTIAAVRAPQAEKALVEKVADRIEDLRQELDESGRRPPGTSEFLDAVNTCQQLASPSIRPSGKKPGNRSNW